MNESQKQKRVAYYTKSLRIVIGFMMAISLNACATAIDTCKNPESSPAKKAASHVPKQGLLGAQQKKYEEVQEKIETNGDFLYHDAVVEPKAFETPYSFYLLGFEKPRDRGSFKPYYKSDETCKTPRFDPKMFTGNKNDNAGEIKDTQKDIEKNLFKNIHPLVLTHILNVKNTSDTQGGNKNSCFIFNVYGDYTDKSSWCTNAYTANILEDGGLKPEWKREGWKGLDKLADNIKTSIQSTNEKPTHIILLATGWNTEQYESYQDFKALMDVITEDFKKNHKDFRPIFIGTSWQSEWNWKLFGGLGDKASFTTKGNDADEIGFTWENYLLNDLIKPMVSDLNRTTTKSSPIQVVVIGHSFGSRIALGAHYTRHIIIRDENRAVSDVPLTIIGMQAAFPIARFVTTEGREHEYVKANKGNATVVITSSKDDKATGVMCKGTHYVGAGCGVEELNKNKAYTDVVTVLKTDEKGNPLSVASPNTVSVYDASPFVNCQLEGTASGAHSDVYDQEMGHFLGDIIRGEAK